MNRRRVAALWNALSFGSWVPRKPTVQLTAAIASCSQRCLQQILLPSQSGAVSQIHCFPDSWLKLPGKPRSPENCFMVGQMHSFSCQHLHLFPHRNSTAPDENVQGIPINFFSSYDVPYIHCSQIKVCRHTELEDKQTAQFVAHSAGQSGILAFIPKVLLSVGLPAAVTYQSVTRSHHMNGFSLQLHILHLVRAFDQFPLHFHCTSKSQVSMKPKATTIN